MAKAKHSKETAETGPNSVDRVAEALEQLAGAVDRISSGKDAPLGFEALVMAIHGEGVPGNKPLNEVLESHGDVLAEAIKENGESIRAGCNAIAASLIKVADAISKPKHAG